MNNILQKLMKAPGLLARKLQSASNAARLNNIVRDAETLRKNTNPVRVLFAPSFAIYHTFKIHDVLLSALLTARGARITYVSSGFAIPSCVGCDNLLQFGEPEQKLCKLCQRFERNDRNLAEDYLKKFADIASLSDFISRQDIEDAKAIARKISVENLESYINSEINIGEYATNIIRNFGYVSNYKLIPDYETKLRKNIAIQLIYLKYFKAVIEKQKPEVIVSHDAFYAPWALLMDLAKKYNLPFYNYYGGLRPSTFYYVKDGVATFLNIDALFNKWRDKDIRERELEKLDKIFTKRKSGIIYGAKETWSSYQGELAKFATLEASGKPLTVMYGNVLWDLTALNRHTIYPSVQETFLQTVRYFIDHPEYNFIIKPHPSEIMEEHEAREKIGDLIRERYPALPENILILQPKTSLTSYDLFAKSKLTISYTTTVGMESVIAGTPTITLGESNYRGRGFTYDPNTVSEYHTLISEILAGKKQAEIDKNRDLARKFYYLYFFVFLHDYNIVEFDLMDKTKIVPRSLDDLLKNKDFCQIADAIINKQPIPYFDENIGAKI